MPQPLEELATQAWQPTLNPWNLLKGGRREYTPRGLSSDLYTSALALTAPPKQ